MNLFFVRKMIGLILMGAVPIIIFMISLLFTRDFNITIALSVSAVAVLFVLNNWIIISNPYLKAIEGSGIPILTLDSSGIIGFFNAKKIGNKIFAKILGKKREALFDRNTLHFLSKPVTAQLKNQWNKQGEEYITFRIKKSDYQKNMYGMQGKPCFVYNTITDTFLTKDMLIEMEDKILAHHMLKYTVIKIEELVSWLRDFGRYIMEQLRPKSGLFQSKWFWILIVGAAIVLMILLFGGPVLEAMSKGGGLPLPTTPITPRK